MDLNKPLLKGSIVCNTTLDSLERGLKRLREFDGHIYHPEDASRQSSSFWFSPPSCGFMEDQEVNTNLAAREYQKVMLQFKLARTALTAMTQSLELEMHKFQSKMQPVVLSRGIANVPDEILARILLFATKIESNVYWRGGIRHLHVRKVCKRFNSIINNQPEMWSYVSSEMRSEELTARLRRSRAVGLKVYLVGDLGDSDRRTRIISALKELLTHAARWELLVLGLENIAYSRSFRELSSEVEFPQLRHFSIPWTTQYYDRERSGVSLLSGRWTTPRLCTLSCEDVLPTVPNAARITKLDLQVSTDDIWSFEHLQSQLNAFSPTLTSLRLEFNSVRVQGNENLTVQLPCLRMMHLHFSFRDFDDVDKEQRGELDEDIERTYKFALFKTPELEHLTVTLSSAIMWPWLMNDFLVSLAKRQRDSAKLRYLNVVHDKVLRERTFEPETNILEVLRNLSAVEFVNISNMLVETSSPSKNSKATSLEGKCFRLRQLHLDRCIETKKQIEGLLQVLTNNAAFPEFEKLVLSNCTGFTWEELAGLKGLEYLVIDNRGYHAPDFDADSVSDFVSDSESDFNSDSASDVDSDSASDVNSDFVEEREDP